MPCPSALLRLLAFIILFAEAHPRHPRCPDFQGPGSLGQYLAREDHFSSFEPPFSHLQDERDGHHLRFLWSCYLALLRYPPQSRKGPEDTPLCCVFLCLRHLKRHKAVDAKRPLAELNSMGYDDDEEMCMKAPSTVPGFREAFSKWELKLNLNDSPLWK